MPRKNNNAGGRKFDTRLSYKEMCKLLGITPKQRIILGRYLKEVDEKKK